MLDTETGGGELCQITEVAPHSQLQQPVASLTPLRIHSVIHACMHACVHSFVSSFAHLFIRSAIHLFVCLFMIQLSVENRQKATSVLLGLDSSQSFVDIEQLMSTLL